MNSQPKSRTTVVVLNWNSHEMTAECIRSLLAMDGAERKILVVDNGSTDGSVELLPQEFPQITVLPQGRNLGFAAGCNVGMRHALAAGAVYVLLVNNDTIVDRCLLQALLDEAERHPEAAMISPKIYYYDSPDRLWWVGGTFSHRTGIPKHLDLRKRDIGQHNVARNIDWATGCVLLIRVRALHDAGLFDEQFFGHVEDVDLSLRVRAAGYSIRYAPLAKVWHKEGVDYRKNAGEHARVFTGSRNLLWLMHKHATRYQWLTFLPNFVVRHVLALVLYSVRRGDFRSAWAVFQGIAAFLRMRANADTSTLPPELMARPKDAKLAGSLGTEKELTDASRD
jgi:GT2 family glycosyltransferase